VEIQGLGDIDTNVWEGWGDHSKLQQELDARRERLSSLGRMALYVYSCAGCHQRVWYDYDDTDIQYLADTKTPCRCYHSSPVPEPEAPIQQVRFEETPFWKRF